MVYVAYPARPKEEVFTLEPGRGTGSFRGQARATKSPRISGNLQRSKRSWSHQWELEPLPEKPRKEKREGRNASAPHFLSPNSCVLWQSL